MFRRRRASKPVALTADELYEQARAQARVDSQELLSSVWNEARALRATATAARFMFRVHEGARAIAQLAADLTGSELAAVNIITSTGQITVAGINITEKEVSFEYSYCKNVVGMQAPLQIEDSRTFPLVMDSPATVDNGIRSYLGIPLTTHDGYVVGALCVANYQPKLWKPEDLVALTRLAGRLMALPDDR